MRTTPFLVTAALALSLPGCGTSTTGPYNNQNPSPDFAFVFTGGGDDAAVSTGDDAGTQASGCNNEPGCHDVLFDPGQMVKFPLSGDMPADSNESNDGIGRDKNGYLQLDSSRSSFDYAWTANTDDWMLGSVSKFDTKTVREVARYFTVTCQSTPTGSRKDCDGKNGCCALDSAPQWQNRKGGKPSGPAQQVQISGHSNDPSRTAIDFDGNMWVANRAVYQMGAQGSVTKIANDPSSCIDRNKNGKIDTSKDVNGDGIIQSDCNGDSLPDDIASVKAKPCTNGMAQEFYGLDDECILLTTNIGQLDGVVRPLALGPGDKDFGPSDVWVGEYMAGKIYRLDGTTGLVKVEVQMPPPCVPPQLNDGGLYGFVIDSSGIGWSALLGQDHLCYWDTKNPQNTGVTRNATVGVSAYGIGIDRDQNIWLGGSGSRYSPTRGAKFADLGQGFWTGFSGAGGSGVACDDRTPMVMGAKPLYFCYFASGGLVQVPASTIPVPKGMDTMVQANNFPMVQVKGGGKGVDIAVDGNVMVTFSSTAGIQRVKVDAMGVMAQPDLQSPPMGNNKCPSGDYCENNDHGQMSPYTYSDFTGFGLRNYTRPKGSWSYVVKGCTDEKGNPVDTKWWSITYTGDTPLNTKITVKARSGNTPMPDQTWGNWTPDQAMSPVDLTVGGILMPNFVGNLTDVKDGFLQVEADLSTSDKNSSPKLHSIQVAYSCGTIG